MSVPLPETPSAAETPDVASPTVERLNVFFRLTAVGAVALIVTVFVFLALIFDESGSPIARFFDRHAIALLAIETAFTLATGFVAMAVDRRRTLARLHAEMAARLANPPVAAESVPGRVAESDDSRGFSLDERMDG